MRWLAFLRGVPLIFDRLALAPRADVTWSPLDERWFRPDPSSGGGFAGFPISPDTASRVSAVFACNSLIAETIASLPCILYRRLDNGGKERAKEHPLYRTMRYQPNGWMTAVDFFGFGQGHVGLRGNVVNEIREGRNGLELIPHHPSLVTIEQLPTGRMRYRVRDPRGGPERTLSQDEVLHVRDLPLDGFTGVARAVLAREAIAVAAAGEAFVGGFFRNDATGRVVLEHPGPAVPDAEKRKEFREELAGQYSGWKNTRKPMILWGGMKASELGKQEDSNFIIDPRNFQVADIARFWRVPLFMIGLEEKSTCLPADALVYTEQGPKPVTEVKVGDRVWSSTGDRFELAEVAASDVTGIQPILTIETRGRTLRCTANHRVRVRRKLAAPRPGPGGSRGVAWKDTWVRADEVGMGDYLVGVTELPESSKAIAPNGRALTPQFMELCGLLLGDGHINKASIMWARHRSAPYMDAYRDAIRSELECCVQGYPALAAERARRPARIQEHERSSVVASLTASEELRVLGFSGTAHTKRVPGWVFGLRSDLRVAFLRGYLDADGSVNTRGWIAWSSCQRALLEDIRHLCLGLGVPVGRVRRYAASGAVEIGGRVVQRGDMYQAFCYNPDANSRIGSHDPRYRERWKATTGRATRVGPYSPDFKGRGPRGSRPGETFQHAGASLLRVKRISRSTVAQPVYDLSVAGTHTFISDGVLVHNSWGTGIEQQKQGFVDFTIRVHLTRWEQAMARDLLTEDERDEFFFEFLLADLLRGDLKSRSDALALQKAHGVISPNEWRIIENMNPREGGDAYQETPQGAAPNAAGQATEDRTPPTARVPAALIRDAAGRIAAAEVREVDARKAKAAADRKRFAVWAQSFYADQRLYVAKVLAPLSEAFGLDADTAGRAIERSGLAALADGIPEDWAGRRAHEILSLLTPDCEVPC